MRFKRQLSARPFGSPVKKTLRGGSLEDHSLDAVSEQLGTTVWVPMPRFPKLQGTKIRPTDDGSRTKSAANSFRHITERLAVPSMDFIISISRILREKTQAKLGGWSSTKPQHSAKSQFFLSTGG